MKHKVGQQIKILARCEHIIYHSNKVGNNVALNGEEWAITSWLIKENKSDYTFDHNLISITGTFQEPIDFNTDYNLLIEETEHPKYGKQFKLTYLNKNIDFSNLENQREFLKEFLTDGQIEAFYDVYDNPLEVIQKGDLKALCKVKGVGEYVGRAILRRFSENQDLGNAIIQLSDYGLNADFIRKGISTFKSATNFINIVKNNPYELIYHMDRVGFATADNIALKGGMDPKSYNRIKGYILYYLNSEAENGNSYVTSGELFVNVCNYFGGKEYIIEYELDTNGKPIESNMAKAIRLLKEENRITLEDGENKSRRRIYLNSIYNLEKNISDNLKRLMSAKNRFDCSGWEDRVKALEKKQGFPFDETQIEGIKLCLESPVCFITGSGGTGKSSLVSGVLAGLGIFENHKYSFAQCALSGKAAARLQEVTGEEGYTIHRLLQYDPSSNSFVRNEDYTLDEDIIILDEVSLVGGEIFLDLIKAISTGNKLIMLGDMGQLEAIGKLNLAADLYNSPIIPTVELKKIHRQAAKSGIITCAKDIRDQIQVFDSDLEGSVTKGELQDMTFSMYEDKEDIVYELEDEFKKWYNSDIVNKDIMNIQLISPVRERGDNCVYRLNLLAQSITNPKKQNDQVLFMGDSKHPYEIRKGDKVMCIMNNYNIESIEGNNMFIYNGWTGIVKEINNQTVTVDFPLSGTWAVIPLYDAKSLLTLGYASTVHKLQGSSAKVVIGVIDYSTPPQMLTNSLVYTLLTRAEKQCTLFGQTGAVCKAIATNFVSTKRTFLKELLEYK